VFYGAWNWKFLFLIFISTIIDYFCGIKINKSNNRKTKKLFLFFSVLGNLSILGIFKYFNFFASNLQDLLSNFGITIQPHFLNIILPVGISFYTFQTLSYTIDIYRNNLKPTKKFFDFALFVAFFPQLVAGPIERAKHLLPQILYPRQVTLDKFYEGSYLIFWGLFQKVFIADNLARIVDPVFASGFPYNGVRVLIATYAFAFQIFCDFAGYSNIARGLGKCMGFDIMINFKLPYFAANPKQFWQRWHISLSSWLRDYLYIPLGGNRRGKLITYRNLIITMLLGGFWHGASWTFILWGAYHGLLLIIYKISYPLLKKLPSPKTVFIRKIFLSIKVIFFFHLICLGWLIFRVQSISHLSEMLRGMFLNFKFIRGIGLKWTSLEILFFIGILGIVQLIQYWRNDLMVVFRSNAFVRMIFYYLCFFLILLYGVKNGTEFIYFQF
jgi:D-alanyl-lipoteichoic acid acyltransferase DltB (MBOAT superfamily)